MKHIILLSFILVFSVFAQNISKEISRTFVAGKDSKIIISGELDVIIENWTKQEISVNAILDIDLKNVFSFNPSGEHDIHDITIRKDGSDILITRKKPGSGFSLVSFIRDRSRVVIYMPDWINLEADISDASLVAENLSGIVRIKGEDGSIVINNLSSPKAKIQFDDGSFKCKKMSGLAVITYNDGSVRIGESGCDKLIAHFDDGAFKVKLNKASRKTYIEFNDGTADVTLIGQEYFQISAEYGDGRVRNRTALQPTHREESKIELGEKDAVNIIQTWFDDGSLIIRSSQD